MAAPEGRIPGCAAPRERAPRRASSRLEARALGDLWQGGGKEGRRAEGMLPALPPASLLITPSSLLTPPSSIIALPSPLSHSLLEVYEISKEINQEMYRGHLLIFLSRSLEISKEINQELHRGLLLIFLIRSV